MAVNVLPALSSNTPSMNKRLPPMADRSSLSYKLTNLSKQKLAREATAPDPDIRRCLGHFRLHCRSMEWAQQEMASKINSFELEDDESEEEDSRQEEQKEKEFTPATPTPVEREVVIEVLEVPPPTSPKDAEPTIHMHFEVVAPLSETEKEIDPGLVVDKGRSCLENARKPFWPSPAQCMPVPIAG